MITIDITPIADADVAYDKAAIAVAEKYEESKNAWNDAVYDSFRSFVSQIKENGVILHRIKASAEIIEKALTALNIEKANGEAQRLAKEADTL